MLKNRFRFRQSNRFLMLILSVSGRAEVDDQPWGHAHDKSTEPARPIGQAESGDQGDVERGSFNLPGRHPPDTTQPEHAVSTDDKPARFPFILGFPTSGGGQLNGLSNSHMQRQFRFQRQSGGRFQPFGAEWAGDPADHAFSHDRGECRECEACKQEPWCEENLDGQKSSNGLNLPSVPEPGGQKNFCEQEEAEEKPAQKWSKSDPKGDEVGESWAG